MAPAEKKTDEPGKDPYEVLGIPFSSSDVEITKAYRKLALKYHPDKQKDDRSSKLELERIAQKFQEIQEARDFLLDFDKRRKYDAKKASMEARKAADRAREEQMSAKRRRLRDELARQEQSARSGHESQTSVFTNKHQSRSKVEELRKQGKEMRETFAGREQNAKKNDVPLHQSSEIMEDRQIRLKWSRKRMKISPSEHDIAKIMEKFGAVENVELIGKKANAALVTFLSRSSCTPCVDAYLNSEEMRASYVGSRKEDEERKRAAEEEEDRMNFLRRQDSAQKDHESVQEYTLRRAAEREQILREMEQKEDDATLRSKGKPKATTVDESSFPPDFPTSDDYGKCQMPYEKLLLAEEQILSAILCSNDG